MRQLRILIVEDQDDAAFVLSEFIRITYPDANIERARDGLEGLNKIGENTPDVVFLDLMMPKFDGQTLLEELERNPPNHKIHIYVISAYIDPKKEKELAPYTLEGILEKPVNLETLKLLLDRAAQSVS